MQDSDFTSAHPLLNLLCCVILGEGALSQLAQSGRFLSLSLFLGEGRRAEQVAFFFHVVDPVMTADLACSGAVGGAASPRGVAWSTTPRRENACEAARPTADAFVLCVSNTLPEVPSTLRLHHLTRSLSFAPSGRARSLGLVLPALPGELRSLSPATPMGVALLLSAGCGLLPPVRDAF